MPAHRKRTSASIMIDSVEFHYMIAARVGATYCISRFFRFRNLQHASSLITLNFESFRCCLSWCIAQGTADICGPSKAISVRIWLGVHLFLFQREAHFSLSLFGLGAFRCFSRHAYRSPLAVVVFNYFGCILHQDIQKFRLQGCGRYGRSFRVPQPAVAEHY